MIEIKPPTLGLSAEAATILRALPEWFGIEEATQSYIKDAGENPTLLALSDNQPVGFLTLLQHSPSAAEIYVMGVLPTYHRKGIGRRLIEAAEQHLRTTNTTFLQVKTLSDKHPDEGYKRTRAFYQAMGFVLLEEFPDLWGPTNPCWQLIKTL